MDRIMVGMLEGMWGKITEDKSPILTSLGIDIDTRRHHVKTITKADIMRFAEVSGDFNPVHISSSFAKEMLLGAELSMECRSRN